jgi:F-type H+-transporting ATPase subunit delta
MAEPSKLETRVRSVMEDPSSMAVAKVYAEAFLKASRESGIDQSLEEFRSFVDDVLGSFPEFARLLTSGVVGRDEKLEIIERTVAGRGSELFTNFLRVLARHDRLGLLPQICSRSERLHELETGKRRVQVASAVPLSDDLRNQISGRLRDTLGFTPILEPRVEPELLGGLVIRVGDTVYDSSLRTRLRQLRERIRQRKLHEIQSGRDRFSHLP